MTKPTTTYTDGTKNTTGYYGSNDYAYLLIDGAYRLLVVSGGGLLLDVDPTTHTQPRKVSTSFTDATKQTNPFSAISKPTTNWNIYPYGTVTLGSTTVTLGSTTVTLDDLYNSILFTKPSTSYTET